MALSKEYRVIIRHILADTRKLDIRSVVDEAKLFVDLSFSESPFEAIKSQIGKELSTNLSPVFDAVLSRVVEKDFQLTKDSMQSIVEYLGTWPKLPKKRVSYSSGPCIRGSRLVG